MDKQIYTLSFIYDESYYEDHLELTEAERDEISRRLDAANLALPYGEKVSDLQLFVPGEVNGSAAHLVDTVASALDKNLDEMDEQARAGEPLAKRDQELLEIYRQACALDRAIERSDRVAMSFDFVWNNGGGDDNAFSQGFTVAPEQQREAWAVLDGLSNWVEATDAGYAVNPGIVGSFEPSSAEEGLNYLAEAMDDIGADGWAKALRDAITPEVPTVTLTPVPAAPASRPRRLR